MNLAIRGIDGNLGQEHADSFHRDLHPDLKADFVLANPPFNDSDWGGERLKDDKRWKYGIPPAGNANFAWVQHFIYHLTPTGLAGFVLANGSMSSNQSGEGEIRKNIIEADLLLKGEGNAADNIVGGPEHWTLSNDAFPDREFDFMLSNPPYGKGWKSDLERMGGKSGIKDPRFVVQHRARSFRSSPTPATARWCSW